MTEITCPKGHTVSTETVKFVDGNAVCPWCAQGWPAPGATARSGVRRGLASVMCIVAVAFVFATIAGIFEYHAYSGNGSQSALLTGDVLASIQSAGLAVAAAVAAVVLVRRD